MVIRPDSLLTKCLFENMLRMFLFSDYLNPLHILHSLMMIPRIKPPTNTPATTTNTASPTSPRVWSFSCSCTTKHKKDSLE